MDSFLHSGVFLIIVLVINITLFILYILSNIKLSKLRKNYSDFMSKMGKGENLDEMIKEYINKVEKIDQENQEIEKYCEILKEKVEGCIYKIGLVRYNAFKDTGSNLSFALAMLNENNDGVVLNGIYSRDSSNIYCKTVKQGIPEYAVSDEEKDAIEKAIQYSSKVEINKKKRN